MAANRSPNTGTGKCHDAASGRAPTGAIPVSQEISVPNPTATVPPGMRPLNRTRPKYVSMTIRIEDTDQTRSTDESIQIIIDGMKWLGLDWDEGPFRQTERMAVYREHVERLLKTGKAYYCYCTPEELETRRKEAIAAGKPPKYDRKCRSLSAPIAAAWVLGREETVDKND